MQDTSYFTLHYPVLSVRLLYQALMPFQGLSFIFPIPRKYVALYERAAQQGANAQRHLKCLICWQNSLLLWSSQIVV